MNPRILCSLIIILTLLIHIPCQSQCCVSSPSAPSVVSSTSDSFDSQSAIVTYSVCKSAKSSALYFMYYLSDPDYLCTIRKIQQDGTEAWGKTFEFGPIIKSLAVDINEQNVYAASYGSPISVCRMKAENGQYVSTQSFINIDGSDQDTRVYPLDDSLGYYITGKQTTSTNAFICKYLFVSQTNAYCQQIGAISSFAFGGLKINDSQIFILGTNSINSIFHYYKITFGNNFADWANQMTNVGSWTISWAESLLNSDSSLIYSFSVFGNPLKIYFTTFLLSNGSVIGNRYKSGITCYSISGSVLSGNYIVTAVNLNPYSLLIYNVLTTQFTLYKFSGTFLGQISIDSSSERIVIIGGKSGLGYTSKMYIDFISLNSDFTNSQALMSVIPSGADSIISEPSVALGVATSSIISQVTSSSVARTFISTNTYTSDINFNIAAQSIVITEDNNLSFVVDLPCSSSTSSVLFSLSKYNNNDVPTFVSINSTTGVLNILAPVVASTVDYSFNIDSVIPGVSSPVSKLINLRIYKCSVSNCQKCKATDSTVCQICKSGYSIDSGRCIYSEIDSSTTALSITTISVVGLTSISVIVFQLLNNGTFESVWSMINQIQLYFFLLLVGTYIPKDVEAVIIGFKFCMNQFSFYKSNDIHAGEFSIDYFSFEQTDPNLSLIGINSGSIIINIYPILSTILMVMICHLFILCFFKILSKLSSSFTKCWLILFFKWMMNKQLLLLSFGFYIRYILESNQYVLLSCISEIREHNTSSVTRSISFVISTIILGMCCSLIIVTFILAFQKVKTEIQTRNQLAQLFDGVIKQAKYRMYIIALLCRRITFVAVLLLVTPKNQILAKGILTGVQFIYTGFIAILRPFTSAKSNLIEIINEIYFFALFSSLLFLDSEKNWGSITPKIYIWVICSNSFSNAIINLFDFCLTGIAKLKSKCKKNSSISPVQGVEDMNRDSTNINNRSVNPTNITKKYLTEEAKSNDISV